MKIIIFDFDGTIADSFKLIIDVTHNITGHHSLTNPKDLEDFRHENMVKVIEQLGVPKYRWPFLLYRGRHQMSKRLGEVKPFDGMDNVLSSLQKLGYRMMVMSSNSTKNVSLFLTKHGLGGYFEQVYGGVGLLNKSAALRKILGRNKLKPMDVIYVGDEVRDVEAAKSVQVPIVAVAWGFNSADRLASEGPMVVVRDRPELLKVLESWEVN